MKGIRRFQRTMIVLLVGVNILVFSSSFYGEISTALGHAMIGMCIAGGLLLGYGLFLKTKLGKKSFPQSSQSREN